MLKRYIASRNNPWELLLLALVIFAGGLLMLLQTQPMIAVSAKASRMGGKPILEMMSPQGAHIVGAIAVICSALIVVWYFWARRAIARSEPHVVEHGRERT